MMASNWFREMLVELTTPALKWIMIKHNTLNELNQISLSSTGTIHHAQEGQPWTRNAQALAQGDALKPLKQIGLCLCEPTLNVHNMLTPQQKLTH
ncbi:hypothetical protein Tco_0425891 [Tanacetum coccineum]